MKKLRLVPEDKRGWLIGVQYVGYSDNLGNIYRIDKL